eukprot:TRINITY_DN829_c0_g1_i1.p1 TRINITY_DN829_c0_g1~~TRINITY_DN829_c0_g1_i1.p1  ORF type:complete len:138 (+),score=48.39 TRINITY_DN829_c0_g1_i1:248-661(+)
MADASKYADLDQRKLFKEGQKQMTPPVADSTRGFYESLLEENPDSIIAIRYCVEYGCKSLEVHKKLLKKYNNLKDKGAFSMGAKIKAALEKKSKGGVKKDKKDKENKEGKENKEKKEKKEKKDKKEEKEPKEQKENP